MFILLNVTMKMSNVNKKNKRTTKCNKSMISVMLVLFNVKMKLLNVRGRKKKPPNASKVQSYMIAQCDHKTFRCE